MHSIFLNKCLRKLFKFEIFLKFDFKFKLSCLTFLFLAVLLSLGTQSTIMVKIEAKKSISAHCFHTIDAYYLHYAPVSCTFYCHLFLIDSNRFTHETAQKVSRQSVQYLYSAVCRKMSHSYWNSHKTAFQYE